jgi:hypothetical protein
MKTTYLFAGTLLLKKISGVKYGFGITWFGDTKGVIRSLKSKKDNGKKEKRQTAICNILQRKCMMYRSSLGQIKYHTLFP